MKSLLLSIGSLSLSLVITVASAAQEEAPIVMPGTEPPVSHSAGDNGECFVFAKYVVKTNSSEDGGANVSLYKRSSSSEDDPCQISGDAWLYVADSDNNSFFGISGRYLFIDMGTSSDSRDLDVYDLSLHKPILSQSYSGDPKLADGHFLLFDAPSDKKGLIRTCKEAAKWKRQGGSVGWVQGQKLDLDTQKAVNVGTLRCVYLE